MEILASDKDLVIFIENEQGDKVRLHNTPGNSTTQKYHYKVSPRNYTTQDMTTGLTRNRYKPFIMKRQKRELVNNCSPISHRQTVYINGCKGTIEIKACLGSCPRDGKTYLHCRQEQFKALPLKLDCPASQNFSTSVLSAEHCVCFKL